METKELQGNNDILDLIVVAAGLMGRVLQQTPVAGVCVSDCMMLPTLLLPRHLPAPNLSMAVCVILSTMNSGWSAKRWLSGK